MLFICGLHLKTKLGLFSANVKSVLFYGSQTHKGFRAQVTGFREQMPEEDSANKMAS